MAKINIQRRSFSGPEAASLIKALDQELASMYPDWPNLPHPGENLGLKALPPNLNSKPPDNESTGEMSILSDAEPGMGKHASADGEEDLSAGLDSQLVYFVAYAVENADAGETVADPQPVGCMGIKVEKYYPYHHPPEDYEEQYQQQVRQGIAYEYENKTAQLKRLYVAPSYRSTSFRPSIAASLLQHLESYAKEDMSVKRLVVETGVRQIGAIKLYERAAWKKIDNFGDYASSSVEKGGVSICFEKML